MISRHKQLFRHDPSNGIYGDCYRTAIACLMGRRPEEVPHFCQGQDDGQTDDRVRAFLRPLGLVLLGINFNGDCDLEMILRLGEHYSQGMPYLLSGTSRTGCNHVVVCIGNEITHDPSLNESGIIAPMDNGLWMLEWLVRPVHAEDLAA